MTKTTVYECPVCGCMVKNRSGTERDLTNTKYYSDGSLDADAYPNHPALTECRQCRNIFLMAKRHRKGSTEELRGTIGEEELNNIPYGGPVNSGEVYLDHLKLCTTDKQRMLLRMGAWWAFNRTYIRKKDIGIYGREDYIDNCRVLIKYAGRFWYYWDFRVMEAEICRNLGEFDKCKKILDTVPHDIHIRKKIMEACEAGRVETFRFTPPAPRPRSGKARKRKG